ncbi:MAG: acyl-CoA thioesterase [Verrucomicrobiota bacterium]
MSNSKSIPFLSLFWGNSVALSWMWGLGLFFSVQFTFQFGILGLLSFAIPNAIGLFAFGAITDAIAKRGKGGESLADFFTKWSKPFLLPLLLYQFIAISLTIFAFVSYFWKPMGLEPTFLYLPLGLLVVVAAAFLFGEEFSIRRIKWSHSVMFLIVLAAIGAIYLTAKPNLFSHARPFAGSDQVNTFNFLGLIVPLTVGLLVGPWMDLQQWQRAIEIRREGGSVTRAYAVGSIFFFLLLLFHGSLAHWALSQTGTALVKTGLLDFSYAHHVLTQYFYSMAGEKPVLFGAYATFISVCVLTTLDSGYIALKWFFTSLAARSKSIIFTLLPVNLFTSPIPVFLLATLVAGVGSLLKLELEYFMMFYGTFFVGYSTLGMIRGLRGKTDMPLHQVKMFCLGAISVVTFAFGYLQHAPLFQIIGSLIPLGYIIWLLIKGQAPSDTSETLVPTETEAAPTPQPAAPSAPAPAIPAGAQLATGTVPMGDGIDYGHFEGRNFVHSFLSTYSDTNSVGNVYFGMYAMWVGKTRELFFNNVLPNFDLDTTDYFILTRSFEHKFINEAKEFEKIRVELSIGDYNRKFATLEHKVLDGANKVLGKGKQSLMFVASKDYSLIDIPGEVMAAFTPYTVDAS